MDAGKPKKKRSELELLLSNGDAGGLVSFSPKLATLSISSPTVVEATAESDEQLARRLHEELNGMRMTRRGSKAVTEDVTPLSPVSRGMASPIAKPKPETPRAHGSHQGGQGRSSLPSLPAISESVPGPAGGGAGSIVAEVTTAEAGGRSAGTVGASGASCPSVGPGPAPGGGQGAGPAAEGGGGEVVKRKRNSVPARELHLLLQQASSAAGRGDTALSPTRSSRVAALGGGRTETPPTIADAQHPHQNPTNPPQHGGQSLPRRGSDRSQVQQGQQRQPAFSSASAPVAPLPSSGGAPLLPPPPPLLPPRLKQRYLAGYAVTKLTPPSASASVSNGAAQRPDAVSGAAGGDGGGPAGGAVTPTPTTVIPSCVTSEARNSLLSGHSLEGEGSGRSKAQSLSPSRGLGGAGACTAYTTPEAATAVSGGASGVAPSAASLTAIGPRPQAGTGASVGGCSSTDETENDNENSCAAAAAAAGDVGPSATSPKPPQLQALEPPVSLPPVLKQQRQLSPQDGQGLVGPDFFDEDAQQPAQVKGQEGRAPRQAQACGTPDAGQQQQQQPSTGQMAKPCGQSAAGPLKVPKLPMIRAGRGWYRGRLMRESVDGQRVLVDVPGAPNTGISDAGGGGGGAQASQHQPFWLPVVSDRIWRGSYKGKDWKYLGDGAWEPKPGAFKRGKQGHSSNGLPLPLPSWALDGAGTGTDAEAEAQPLAAEDRAASGRRAKRDRGGWSSHDDASDDADAAEEEQQQQRAAAREGPTTRSGQRAQRRSSPAVAASAVASSVSDKAATTAAAPASAPAPAPAAAASGSGKDIGAAATVVSAVAGHGAASDIAAPASAVATADRCEAECAPAETAAAASGAAAKPDATGLAAAAAEPPAAAATEATAGEPKSKSPQGGDVDGPAAGAEEAARGSQGGASVSASVDCGVRGSGTPADGVFATAVAPKTEAGEEVAGGGSGAAAVAAEDAEEDGSDGPIKWVPGVPYPRTKRPRRAQRRQQRVRTPFDGLQFPLTLHHQSHNPYAFYPGLSGDESGGDGDASDAEAGGRRGSGDGAATAAHHGSRRRAAARAAAVAAAAARAEAEAEEEEQEEILLGRRPPRRDRLHPHSQHGGGGPNGSRRNQHGQHHSRPRNGARADYYMYGDSSGNLDDPWSGDGAAYGLGSSARPRAGSRGTSQPAPECGSGGSGAWELVQWQAAGECGAATQAPQAPPRNRRKGKPSRSRMDGEGDAWCCGKDDWELEAAGGAWARMPEVLRRLYYTPCPAADSGGARDGGSGSGGGAQPQQLHQQQSGGDPRVGRGFSAPHRQSGGGAYFGALHAPNKRRRVYEEDPAVSPDDLDFEMEVDDHEHDADYLPPYGGLGGSRRSSGFGGGRRCSVNGGGLPGAKRQRSGEPFHHHHFYHNSHQHMHHHNHISRHFQGHQMGQYEDLEAAMAAAAPMPRRRIMVTAAGSGAIGTATAAFAASLSGGVSRVGDGAAGGCIPAGLAGLLEAALGQEGAAAIDIAVHADAGNGGVRSCAEVKLESAPAAEAASMGVGGVASGGDVAGAGVLDAQQGLAAAVPPPPPPPPCDPHGSHVALSDSSAGPSGAEEGKGGGGCIGDGDAAAACDGVDVDGSARAACSDGGAAALLQHQQHGGRGSSGGGAALGAGSGDGSPPPAGLQPAGQLRPNTPTRAKRTGRPPSAALGAGAPLPKLPALSSTASLRLQMASAMGVAGLAVAAGTGEGLAAATASATAVSEPLIPLKNSVGGEGREPAAVQEVADMKMAEADDQVRVPPAAPTGRENGTDMVGGRSGSSLELWHAGGTGGGGDIATLAAPCGAGADVGATATTANEDDADAMEGDSPGGAACQEAAGTVAATVMTAIATVGADGASPCKAKSYGGAAVAAGGDDAGGGGRCVMDAIGALMYDNQPAMQQLAMRAQLELDSMGLVVVAAAAAQRQSCAAVHPSEQQHQQSLPLLPPQGRQSGSLPASAMASPPASDPLISTLPSVDVVVGLFSARNPYGSAQQVLADLVGGAAALPLFR